MPIVENVVHTILQMARNKEKLIKQTQSPLVVVIQKEDKNSNIVTHPTNKYPNQAYPFQQNYSGWY